MKGKRILPSVVVVALLGGCRYGRPDPAGRQALRDRETSIEVFLQKEQGAYDAAVSASRVPRIAEIADREQVTVGFQASAELLARAKECTVTSYLDDENGGDAQDCGSLLDQAEAALQSPRRRIEAWTRLWADPGGAAATVRDAVTRTRKTLGVALDPQVGLSPRVATQGAAYPDKLADLERRAAALAAAPAELDSKLAVLDSELAGVAEGRSDVAALERALGETETMAAEIAGGVVDLENRMGELDVDMQLVLVRLEKIPVLGGAVLFATTRSERNGIRETELRTQIDGETFASFLAISTGLQQLFPTQRILIAQPPVTLEALCAYALNVEVDLVVSHKAIGQYADEVSESPSPRGMVLDQVGNPSYGSWQDSGDGRTTWQWNAAWGARYGNWTPPPLLDEVYARYSAWRYDHGWACDYDRAGVYQPGGRIANAGCRSTRPNPELAEVACPSDDEEEPNGTATVRGIGPHTRSRGMGGGGK